MNSVKDKIGKLGFSECSTGGGCVAFVKQYPNGAQVLITSSSNEGYIPESLSDPIDIGFYNSDGEQTGWAPIADLETAMSCMDELIRINMARNL